MQCVPESLVARESVKVMGDSGSDTILPCRRDPLPVQTHDDDRFSWKTSTVSTLQSMQSPFSKLPATPSLIDDIYNAPQPSSATSSLASVPFESEPSGSDHPPNKRRDTKETTADCMKNLSEYNKSGEGKAMLLLWEFDRVMCSRLPTIHTPLPLSETKSGKDPSRAPMMAKAIFSKSKSLPPGNLSAAGSLGAGLSGRPGFPWLGQTRSDSAGKVCHSNTRNPHDILALTDIIGRSNSYTSGVGRYASCHREVNKDVGFYKGFASFQTYDQMKNEPDTLVLVPGKRPTTNCS